MARRAIPLGVWFLGLTSLLTDTASEAIYPLLPIFLTEVLGASVLFVGVFEGIAESTASLTKYFAGLYSDRIGRRKPLVVFGYALSNTIRPLIGFALAPWQVLVLRFVDRIGKGVRGAPRDAWLANFASVETRGRIFGLHRAMDHAGAMVGPLIAALFLGVFPYDYRHLFTLTLIPGLFAIIFIFFTRSQKVAPTTEKPSRSPGFPKSRRFRLYLLVLLIFTLGNSSDAFLLLKLKSIGVSVAWIPLLWAGLHAVKMASSFLGGSLSDRVGRRVAIISGWLLYSMMYVAFAFVSSPTYAIAAFFAYGIYYGMTEGPEKALIADLIAPDQHGAAYGLYGLVLGIGALPASLLFGFIWNQFSSAAAFLTGATLSLIASALLMLLLPQPSVPVSTKTS